MNPITDIITGIAKPVTDLLGKRQDRKMAGEAAQAKLVQAKQEGAQSVILNEQEIEAVRTNGLGNSWKDEYITVSIVVFLNLVIVGSIASAFGNPSLLDGTKGAVLVLSSMGVNMGELIRIVVYAGVGISVWRKFG